MVEADGKNPSPFREGSYHHRCFTAIRSPRLSAAVSPSMAVLPMRLKALTRYDFLTCALRLGSEAVFFLCGLSGAAPQRDVPKRPKSHARRAMTITTPNSHFDTSPDAQSQRGKRRRGSRAKLAEKAIGDLCAVWDEQGIAAVRRMAFHDPSKFVQVVAGLMPQKLEITYPTDGLSDERLADLIALAERMAALRVQGGNYIDENRLIDVTPEEGGGGPDRVGDAAEEVVSTLSPSAEKSAEPKPHNTLEAEPPPVDTTARLIAEESTYDIQPPVGKPCATTPQQESRDNLRKLNADDIDPASLF